MARPIPARDRALLAAQAKAGQAGVDAYEAAKAELQSQRSQAVQTAMREAALRGSPSGAIESQLSNVTGPYDQQIAQLTQAQGGYEADLASSGRRAVGYSQAVNTARSLIPGQARLAVAPIRAQGRAELSRIGQQSAAQLAQLAAQTRLADVQGDAAIRLEDARAAAMLQAFQVRKAEEETERRRREAEAAAEAERIELNQSEARAALVAQARAMLAPVHQQASRMAQRNTDVRNASMLSVPFANQGAAPPSATDEEEALNAARGAMFLSTRQPITTSGTPKFGRQQVRTTSRGWDEDFMQRQMNELAEQIAAQQLERTATPRFTSRAGSLAAAGREPVSGSTYQPPPLSQIIPRPAALNPRQLGRLGEFGGLLAQSGERTSTPTDIDRLLGGALDDQGQRSPVASDAFRLAMILGAGGLIDEGYELNDAQILEAIGEDESYNVGDTLFDVESRAAGEQTPREGYESAQDELADLAAEQEEIGAAEDEEAVDATDALLESEFFRQWGRPLTPGLGPREDVIAITSSPQFRQAAEAFQVTEQQLTNAENAAADEAGRQPREVDVEAVLDAAGINDPVVRHLIAQLYG